MEPSLLQDELKKNNQSVRTTYWHMQSQYGTQAKSPDTSPSRLKEVILACYRLALRDWFRMMHARYPTATFTLVGSATNLQQARVQIAPLDLNFEVAQKKHAMAAINAINFTKSPTDPSDLDVIIPDGEPEMFTFAESCAKKVFDEYGVLVHVHHRPPRETRPSLRITEDVMI